jgi:hypothetical protein
MMENPFDPAAFVEAAAPLLMIALTPESRAGAVLHLTMAAEQAELLFSADLGDEDEPAPVFRP